MLGNKQFELSNLPIAIGIGNVLTTVSDRKIPHTSDNITIDYYTSDITSAQDYYAFGQLMPGRNWSSDSYKFGFGNYEKDDEIRGSTGSMYTTEARPYDPLTGRWWSVDPQFKKQPAWSPYKAYLDNPILFQDPAGETEYNTIIVIDENTGKSIKIRQETSSKLMTDGEKNQKDGMGDCYSYENYYYNYESVTTITIGKDGKATASAPITRIMYEDDVQSKETVWAGDNYGDTKTPLSWGKNTVETGLQIWGSAPNNGDSPATKSNDTWGSFDFAEFSDMISIVLTATKTQSDNALSGSMDAAKKKVYSELAKHGDFKGVDNSKKTTVEDITPEGSIDIIDNGKNRWHSKDNYYGSEDSANKVDKYKSEGKEVIVHPIKK